MSCACKNSFRKIQLLMTNAKNFPGIIAPKIDLFVKINITKATAIPTTTIGESSTTCHYNSDNDIRRRRRRITNRYLNFNINSCLCQCPCNRIDSNQNEMKFYTKRQKPVCHTPINNNERRQLNKAANISVNNLDLYRIPSPQSLPRRPSSSSLSSLSSASSCFMVLASYKNHLKYCELCRCYERVFCNKI